MLGREAEWARVERGLGALLDGGVVIALEGAPGIGKTTLWQAGITRARERGFTVRATAPGQPDTDLAFAGLGDLLQGLPDQVVSGLPEPQRRALALALLIDGDTDAAPDTRALPRAVVTVLRGLAVRAPLLVAIDDEQWLDPPTARVLAFALPRVRDAPVGVLIARRPATDGALWPALVDDHRDDAVQRISVEPLGAPAIGGLLTARLGHRLARPVRQRVYAVSGGNPLYALAIAREADQPVDHGGEVAIPQTLAAAIARRLDGIGDVAGAALLAVAAASHATLALVQAVTDGFALSDLDAAVSDEVIVIAGDQIRFTHPLLASAHYSAAPAAHRRAVHRRLAAVLEDPQQRARHLALGAEAPDGQIAAAIEHGATVAAGRGAPDMAADLLEEAARLTPADAGQVRRLRLIRAAELYEMAGDAARCRALLTTVLPELADGPVRARALLALASATDDFDAGDILLEEAVANARDHDRLRARILLWRGGAASNRGQWAAMVEYGEAARVAAERAGDRGLVARALADLAVDQFFTGRRVDTELVQRALELEDPNDGTSRDSPSGAAARISFWSDDHPAGRRQLQRAIQRGRDHGEQSELGALLFELSLLEWYAGNVELANTLYAASAEASGDDNGLWHVCGQAMFAARRGDLEDAREAAHRAVAIAEAARDVLVGAFPVMVLAAVDLWTGQAEKAHDRLSLLRDSLIAKGFGFLGALSLDMWALDVEALVAMSRLEDAQRIADDLFARARVVANPNATAVAARSQSLILGARGELAAALEQTQTALAAHAQRLLRPELARTLLEHGRLLRRAKQKKAAKDSLEQALAIFDEIGASMWAERTRDELARVGLRRKTYDRLTPAQTRVVELACAGHSNQQIANTLYMSLRTVESHLTKAYREFGVQSRAQLVATLVGQSSREDAGP